MSMMTIDRHKEMREIVRTEEYSREGSYYKITNLILIQHYKIKKSNKSILTMRIMMMNDRR